MYELRSLIAERSQCCTHPGCCTTCRLIHVSENDRTIGRIQELSCDSITGGGRAGIGVDCESGELDAEAVGDVHRDNQFPAPWLGLVQIVPSHGATALPAFEGVSWGAALGLVRTLALGAGWEGSAAGAGWVLVTEVVVAAGCGDCSSLEHAVESSAAAAMNMVAAIVRIIL